MVDDYAYDDDYRDTEWGRGYDPQSEYEGGRGFAVPPPAPMALANPKPGWYGLYENSGARNGYMDLSYWQSRDEQLGGDTSIDDIFDTNTGQLKPGWSRTKNGYERTPTAGPGPGPGPIDYYGGGGGTGGGGGPRTLGEISSWKPYDAPDYQAPGAFTPPDPFTYEGFNAPTAESMWNEPGLKFRMDTGRKALESSAASRGTLKTGGTLKSILEYGQNFGEAAYGNVFDRALTTYGTNRGNAADIWEKAYRTSVDSYDREADQSLTQYNTKFQSSKAEAMSAWDKYISDLDTAKFLAKPS